MFQQIAILGPGLLGASLIQAAKEGGLCQEAVAWSRRPETRLKCEKQAWCDAVFATPEETVKKADLVVVCTPVETIVPLLEQIAEHLKPGAIVTDVGSTKSLICRHGQAALGTRGQFLGSHPMAGSEKTGLENATPTLFHQRACFVTPLVETPESLTEKIVRFWDALGMLVTTVSPEKHDEIVAHISHVPHILASTLCSQLAQSPENWSAFAGGGLRDTTRIAAGDPHLWKSIITQNREEILRALQGFEKELDRIRAAVHNNNPFEIIQFLERGKAYRDKMD